MAIVKESDCPLLVTVPFSRGEARDSFSRDVLAHGLRLTAGKARGEHEPVSRS